MFKKILIANRGEIACRIIRSAKRMGIATVAVYSDADEAALHVEMADEAVRIGPPPAAESYLQIDRIVEACKATGAEAVHPGFGFLSERAAFAEALKRAGVVFIGPPVGAIAAMGDKIESKKLAQKASVSTVPGYLGTVESTKQAGEIAREIGYPVMIKAAAGGGGKGMRVAHDDASMVEGFERATSEAISSFGDGRVFIEKFVEEPRHIEIQVLADAHGNCIYLGERECSIQRRHQKVIEEAPSPFLDEATRRAMGEQAVALARAVDYASAGTVEFIVDRHRNFYFLEMNTRLQVEHPVTEMITGIDLVEQMIRVAAGEKLALRQEDVKLTGWALEARVYAEDPARGFLPSTGRLVRCRPPAEGDGVRVDTGVVEGSEISVYYDPMIAKLVTWGPDREAAIDRMTQALDAYAIRGINHNIPFLNAIVSSPRFRSGRLSTAFIAEEFPDGFSGPRLDGAARDALLGAAVLAHFAEMARERRIEGAERRRPPRRDGEWHVLFGRDAVPVEVQEVAGGVDIAVNGRTLAARGQWGLHRPLMQVDVDGRAAVVQVDRRGGAFRLSHGGLVVDARLLRPRAAALAALMPDKPPPDMSKYLLCPMPGLVLTVAVGPGEEVKAGQTLAIVEAMKMENVLRAERDGTVEKVLAKPGDSLAADAVILEFA